MIPKKKITDPRSDRPKAYQEIKHEHEGKPTRLQEKKCQRCHFDVAENSLVDYIKNHTGLEKTDGKVFSKLKVVRGSLDDCIGWITLWS